MGMADNPTCPKCGLEQIRAGAYRCKNCRDIWQREYRARNPEQRKATLKRYAENHPGANIESARRWNREHKEERAAYMRQYYADRKDKIDAYLAERYQLNRATNLERAKLYAKDHPEVSAASNARRKARKRGAVGSHTVAEWKAIVRRQRGLCAACAIECKLTRDHIVPLEGGGTDYAYNIQGLCSPCNSRKRAKMPKGLQHSLFDSL